LDRCGTITQSDIDAFAHHLKRERLAADAAEREQPGGVKIVREALPDGGFRLGIMIPMVGSSTATTPPEDRHMTDADLQLNRERAERELEEARRALVTRRLSDTKGPLGAAAIDRRITSFLQERGVEKPHAITNDERRALHLAATDGQRVSAEAVLSRNAGDWIETPSERVASKEGAFEKADLRIFDSR
jgi:hypothetical protein